MAMRIYNILKEKEKYGMGGEEMMDDLSMEGEGYLVKGSKAAKAAAAHNPWLEHLKKYRKKVEKEGKPFSMAEASKSYAKKPKKVVKNVGKKKCAKGKKAIKVKGYKITKGKRKGELIKAYERCIAAGLI